MVFVIHMKHTPYQGTDFHCTNVQISGCVLPYEVFSKLPDYISLDLVLCQLHKLSTWENGKRKLSFIVYKVHQLYSYPTALGAFYLHTF